MSLIQIAEFTFDPETGKLSDGERSVRLRPKSARLLEHFLDQTQKLRTRDELFESVWPDRIVTDNTLMQSIRELRAALGDSATAPRFIETVHGKGYRWIGPTPSALAGNALSGTAANNRFNLGTRRAPIWFGLAAIFLLLTSLVWWFGPMRSDSSIERDIQRAQAARAQGEPELARRYYEAALIRDADQIEARVGLATMLYEMGEWDRAWTQTTQSRPQPDNGPVARGGAKLDLLAGEIAFGRGQLSAAEALFAQARAHADQNFAPVIHAAALGGLSRVRADQGRIAEYLAIRAELVDPLLMSAQVEAFAEGLLSAGTMVHPSFDERWGLPRLQRALSVFATIGDTRGMARAHTALGSNPALDDAARERHLLDAMTLYTTAEHRPGQLNVLMHLASFEIGRINADAADVYVERGLALSDTLGASRLHADFTYRHGLALMASAEQLSPDARVERLQQARSVFEAAAAEYTELGVVLDGLAPRLHAAIARFDAGDASGALAEFERLSTTYHDLPFPPGELGASLGRVAALAATGRQDEAGQLLAEIETALPRSLAVTSAVRATFPDAGTEVSSPSLFAIIIGAERQLASGDPVSD